MRYSVSDGRLNEASWVASPNFESRPCDCEVELLVIHCISLPPGQYSNSSDQSHDFIQDFFCNKLDHTQHEYFQQLEGLRVSSHLYINREGEVTQFVNFNDRAWHAGASCFNDRENCNDFSIGIELEGLDTDSYTEEQYQALIEISLALKSAYPKITLDNIVGHEDIAPGRKRDPGSGFDWNRYRNGLTGARAVS